MLWPRVMVFAWLSTLPLQARAQYLAPVSSPRSAPAPWWAPLASAALPGAGQAALRQRRGFAYAAAEAIALAMHLGNRNEGRRQRSAYRRLALVARAPFSGTLPSGDFEYYERMTHFSESGAFDRVAGGAIEPEPNAATYNGSVWLLARRTFWQDPNVPPPAESEAYRRAEEFYLERAIRPEYLWSWVGAEGEMRLFGEAITRSNEAFRDATLYLGLVLANHALSAVDAYVTVRLRRDASSPGSLGVEGSVPWAPFGRPRRGDYARR